MLSCGAIAQFTLNCGTHSQFLSVTFAIGFAVALGILVTSKVSGMSIFIIRGFSDHYAHCSEYAPFIKGYQFPLNKMAPQGTERVARANFSVRKLKADCESECPTLRLHMLRLKGLGTKSIFHLFSIHDFI